MNALKTFEDFIKPREPVTPFVSRRFWLSQMYNSIMGAVWIYALSKFPGGNRFIDSIGVTTLFGFALMIWLTSDIIHYRLKNMSPILTDPTGDCGLPFVPMILGSAAMTCALILFSLHSVTIAAWLLVGTTVYYLTFWKWLGPALVRFEELWNVRIAKRQALRANKKTEADRS